MYVDMKLTQQSVSTERIKYSERDLIQLSLLMIDRIHRSEAYQKYYGSLHETHPVTEKDEIFDQGGLSDIADSLETVIQPCITKLYREEKHYISLEELLHAYYDLRDWYHFDIDPIYASDLINESGCPKDLVVNIRDVSDELVFSTQVNVEKEEV